MSKICSKLAIKTPDMNRFYTLRPLLLPNRGGGMRDLSSACKTDRSNFTGWISFLLSNCMKEIIPNTEAFSAKTKAFYQH